MIETLIALAITLAITGAVVALLNPASGSFVSQPEAADMQQRLRVGQDVLYKDLIAAGAGPFIGDGRAAVGPLTFAFAPVMPFRPGIGGPGTHADDTVTVVYVPPSAAHTTLFADAPAGATVVDVLAEPSCGVAQGLCDFSSGASILIFDGLGDFDAASIAGVDNANARLTLAQPI